MQKLDAGCLTPSLHRSLKRKHRAGFRGLAIAKPPETLRVFMQ